MNQAASSGNPTLIPTPSQILTDPRFANTARLLSSLNAKWKPNPAQAIVGKKIFTDGVRRVFIEAGRKLGKTDFAIDLLWRLGNMIQGGQIYYFGALQKSVKEILWSSKRLENHGPRDYIQSINQTDMRLTFASDTFIKLDGADEFKQAKGFEPDVIILDEFADYPADFWTAMSPNFAPKDTIVIIISSPPWLLEDAPGEPVLFVRIADLWKRYAEEAEKAGKKSKYFYINAPTSVNAANLPPGFLENEKQELIALGLEDVYQREYEARRVIAGGKRIIGTFDRTKHVKPHIWIEERIAKDKDILQWATIVDPSQSSFGVLLMAINPYTKDVYFMDEILEKDENETTEHILWPRIKAKEDSVFPPIESERGDDRFDHVCDEAAHWWIVGCANHDEISVTFQPTQKATNSIEYGLSILRSMFRYNKGYVSERCKWFAYYLENWRRDRSGRIPEVGKDLIDCSRYGLNHLDYYLTEEDKKEKPFIHPRERQRMRNTPEQELAGALDKMATDDPYAFSNNRVVGEEEWN